MSERSVGASGSPKKEKSAGFSTIGSLMAM